MECPRSMYGALSLDDIELVIDSSGAHIMRDDANGSRFMIARWSIDEEGGSLEFVGDRPFDADHTDFWRLARIGQKMVDDAVALGWQPE